MLRAIVILSLAAVALAVTMDHKDAMQQIIRIGSVGTAFANVKGVLVPTKSTFTEAFPAFEFRSVVNGAPVVETDHISFRCSMLSDFYVSHAEMPKPVLICRNHALKKGNVMESDKEKRVFLFSAEDLALPSGVSDIELSLGKNLMKSFMTAYSTGNIPAGSGILNGGVVSSITASNLPKYDGYKIKSSPSSYDTMLAYDVPMHRNKRQFGGFGASGSQASAGSFAGGLGGGGGFTPFGGGAAGSGSFASSNSFGAGGGGFLG